MIAVLEGFPAASWYSNCFMSCIKCMTKFTHRVTSYFLTEKLVGLVIVKQSFFIGEHYIIIASANNGLPGTGNEAVNYLVWGAAGRGYNRW